MKTKKIIIFLALIVLIGLIALSIYLYSVKQYRDKVAAITIDTINLSNVSDGIYLGEYDVDFIYAKVEVTVKNGAMTDIHLLEHKNDRGEPAERIIDDIIDKQSLDVDAVTGATNSSKVIKKAIEKALIKGVKE